jgi:hypothetical protein
MATRLLVTNIMRSASTPGRRAAVRVPVRRMGGGGHGHAHEPHIPEGYNKLGKFVLVSGFFWIMYRAKENKGQLFGLYYPWEHEHEHTHHHYTSEGEDTMPKLEEHEEEHEEGHEDEEE